MASAIIATNPIPGTPTTQSVRDNFAAAKSEIEALQSGKSDTAHTHGGVYSPVGHGHAASDITSGTIDIARLPVAALERLVVVANQAARYALTVTNIQQGDTVKETDTGLMWYVVDEANLANASGYQEYTAGAAASVPWAGVSSKPLDFTPSAHGHALSELTQSAATTGQVATWGGAAWVPGTPSGSGDMLKSTYDTTNNGKVDVAESADAVAWANVSGKPVVFTPDAHNHTGTYEPADATILKDADIGGTVQAYDANTAKTNAAQSFTAPQTATATALTDGATVTWPVDTAQSATLSLTGAGHTLTTSGTPPAGAVYMLTVTPTGAYSLGWTAATLVGNLATITQTATSGKTDCFIFRSDGTKLNCIGFRADIGS